jgi:small ligand-binding sensory domain FIST
MRPHFDDGDTITLWFDSVASSNPPKLHHGSQIVAGFYEGCGGSRPQVFGGGLLTDINLSEGWVFDGTQVRRHAVVGLAWPSTLTAETFVMSGCVPASVFLEITRIDGAVVYELDGKPALDVLEGLLSYSMTTPDGAEPLSLRGTLGQKQGDPYAPFSEGNYVNRLILSADRTAGSVTLFEPDFTCGSMVQVMARNNQLMIDSVRQGVETANSIVRSCDSVMALYIDCAGRASVRSGSPVEEAELLANGLDNSVPLVGFYSGVEIAPFGASPRALDWTGLLAIIRYRQ